MKATALNLEGFSLAVFSLILTLLPVFIPVEGLLLTALAPFPLIVLAVKYPWRYALSVMGLEIAGVALLGGAEILLFFSQYGLAPVIIAWAIRREYSVSQTVIWSVGVPLGVGTLLLTLYGLIVHQPPYVLLMNYLAQVVDALQEHFRLMGQEQAVDQEQFKAFVEAFPRFLLSVFPALVVMNHLLTNVFNYVLVRYYFRRSLPPRQLDPEDLTRWRASDHLVWVFLGSGVALLLPITGVSILGLNIFLMTLAIYLLQGFAIAVFWGQRVPFPLGVRLLLTLLIFLLAGPLCIGLCIVAGLFDLWVDFRRQRDRSLVS